MMQNMEIELVKILHFIQKVLHQFILGAGTIQIFEVIGIKEFHLVVAHVVQA